MTQSLENLTQEVASLLQSKNLTVATAESCTGGWIGKMLTDISGSSAYYPGGVIAYSNDIKHKVLGVAAEDLNKYGAVSSQVAQAMALGAKSVFAADIAVAVTGIAGPTGGSADKPVGTVWFAWALPDGSVVAKEERFTDSREDVRKSTVYKALDQIRQIIAE